MRVVKDMSEHTGLSEGDYGILGLLVELGNGVQVNITPAGKSAVIDSRPIVAKAIRKHFLDHLTEQDIELITTLAERIDKRFSD
ncbi:hypothetical protein [Paenibacillus wynnii]|uniref:hypothetical protein n=1 Tax=Paenibacillus wynnii TaxID=268407 RepID=UPI00068FDC58|nr:hypothetical protein [Paenibacillus wynnii]